LKASSTCTVNFDNVKIPHDQLLGEEGQGYKYAIESLNEGALALCSAN
jgi:short/branched chain acyl-CoA dehydrogenase